MNKDELPKSYRYGGGIDVSGGGYIAGPSHEEGGIYTRVRGGEDIEIEGTEYIINGEAVKALGIPFLDKLNATGNNYWPTIQGFKRGELRSVGSNYRRGGAPTQNQFQSQTPQQKINRLDCTKPYKCPGTSPCCNEHGQLNDIPGETYFGLQYEHNNPYLSSQGNSKLKIPKPKAKRLTAEEDIHDDIKIR